MSKVMLKKPIKRGDDEITEINLREPDTGSLRGLEMFSILRMDINTHRQLVPRISDINANEFDMLKPSDLVAVQTEVVGFFTE
ncbi:phage tail assembly protein [Vibrio parahaemolyticus]|uniref:phage tail assembly protein n=1 Tax=Vibrio parahaemolyticus TaxID=670 RepID=UPI001D16BB42|nr:phage tail assembly protein [Vibrio parahaemolyticus]MCC3798269.1 phage tail assembly protein [Vibrio parahaemolyticus]